MSKQNYKHKQQSHGSNNLTISTGQPRAYEIEEQNERQGVQERQTPSYQEIEVLAYWIHEEKGGTDLDNWLEAERMLKEKNF